MVTPGITSSLNVATYCGDDTQFPIYGISREYYFRHRLSRTRGLQMITKTKSYMRLGQGHISYYQIIVWLGAVGQTTKAVTLLLSLII